MFREQSMCDSHLAEVFEIIARIVETVEFNIVDTAMVFQIDTSSFNILISYNLLKARGNQLDHNQNNSRANIIITAY